MADDPEENEDVENDSAENEGSEEESDDEKSFRERVEEIRQQRAEQGEGDGDEIRSPAEEMMGGGPGMGGNPFAQMMGGMMGGGPGMGAGPGGHGHQETEGGNEELVREVRKVRDELHDIRRSLDRIADTLEDD